MFRAQAIRFKFPQWGQWTRNFSVSARRDEIRDIETLPQRLLPGYQGTSPCQWHSHSYWLADDLRPESRRWLLVTPESHEGDLLSLQWPAPPRNIFIVKKDFAPSVTEALVEFVKYDHNSHTRCENHLLIFLRLKSCNIYISINCHCPRTEDRRRSTFVPPIPRLLDTVW